MSSPTTPTFPTFEHTLSEEDVPKGTMQFGSMDPVYIDEARERASIARERSMERKNLTRLDVGSDASKKGMENETRK